MSPYHGPYTVIRQTSRVTYALQNNHTKKKISAHVTLMKPAYHRPAHLVPSTAAPAPAPVAPLDSVPSAQEPQDVSRQTRAQRSTRLRQQAAATSVGVPNGSSQSPASFAAQQAATDMEQKHSPVPQ